MIAVVAARKARSSSAEPDRHRPRKKPRDFALLRLGRRAHSVFELSSKMQSAGYSEEEVRSTIDFLSERRYLDDRGFAEDYARAAAENRKWGPLRIEQALRRLGVAEADIEPALTRTFAEGEGGPAAAALSRFWRIRKRSADSRRERARAYRHLLSRGFSPDVVHRLVSDADFEDTHGLDDTT